VTRIRFGAIAWICTLQFFVVETFAGLGWPGYDFFTDRISDLGAARSPHHALVNASLLLQGALIAGGALLLREAFPPGRLRSLGIAFVAQNGLGVLIVGLVPEDANRALHDVGAILLFLSGNLGMLALGTALLHVESRLRAIGTAAVAFGAIGLIGAAGFALRAVSARAIGTFEHVAVDPLPLWLLMAGLAFAIVKTGSRGR